MEGSHAESGQKVGDQPPRSDPVPRVEWLPGPVAREFLSSLPERPTKEVLNALRHDPRLMDFLGRHKLERLEFSGRLPEAWFGSYKHKQLAVWAFRPVSSYGLDFAPGHLPSVSASGKTLEEAMQRSLYHEVGHHILYTLNDPELIRQIGRLRRSGQAFPVSERAKDGGLEYFCETFAAYRFEGSLADKDPEGYDMVEKVLRMAWRK